MAGDLCRKVRRGNGRRCSCLNEPDQKLGGQPELREGFTTDNGNVILDVRNMDLVDPVEMETRINAIPGVVTCGLFAHRGADEVLIASESGIRTL